MEVERYAVGRRTGETHIKVSVNVGAYRVSQSLGFVLLMLVDIYVMILISTIPSDPNVQERRWPNSALGPRSSRMESS